MSILRGTIYITNQEDVVYNIAMTGNARIISLDEDGVLMKNDAILVGTCLLPPVEAKIAEADGNEQLYDVIYSNHLLEPAQREFISALLAYLYKGGNLILFLPELGYTNTMDKFVFHMFNNYGVHIGNINNPDINKANCYYDESCVPMWLNMIYLVNVISPLEYLAMYPIDAIIPKNGIMEKLIDDFNPFGVKSINDQINYILHMHKQLHKNPNIRPAIRSSIRSM